MNRPEFRIPEEKTQEVFTLAAQLYAEHNQSYSVAELMEAGVEAKIPPEFIRLAIGLPLLAAIATAGWLIARNAATTAQTTGVPINTEQPLPNQPPISDANPVAGNFKCANLKLEGQDLSGQNLRGVDCTNAKLANVNLTGANLEGANLSKTDLKNAKLNGANLKGADLANADLAKVNLTGANLEGANLSNTNLKGAILKNTNVTRADLAGAQLDGAKK
jgi:hypothetical protein